MSRHVRRASSQASSADLAALAAVSVWSVNVIVVKVALRDAPPLLYTAVRFLAGGLILIAAVRLVTGTRSAPRRDWTAIAIAGALGIAANQTAFTVALRYTTAVDVSLIIGATPLLVAAYTALRSRERIGARAWSGMVVGAGGLVLVVAAGGGGHGALGGDLIALAAPAVWAVYLERLTRLLPRHPPLVLSANVTFIGALPLVPFAVAEGVASPPHVSWQLLGLLAFSTVLAVGFCNLAYYAALERLGATRVAVYTYLQPFLGAVVAFIVLGETLRPLQLIGGAVVIAGVVAGRPPAAPVHVQAQAVPPSAAREAVGAGTG